MPEGDHLKEQALNNSHDFYELLGIQEGAQESEIRRAYRQTAKSCHPDKVGANPQALEKFHLLSIAYDVLSDPAIRELYDNARRAKEAKQERDRLFEGRRKAMKEDLERRENGVAKRKRDELDAEEEFARELRRLAEDGKRRRKQREEMLRKEAEEGEREEGMERNGRLSQPTTSEQHGSAKVQVDDIDRSITLRFPQTHQTQHIDDEELRARFERFGPIENVVLREKKIKLDGEKHRKPYISAVLLFQSVVGAHAAISDLPKLSQADPERYAPFEAVGWAAGKAPEYIPAPTPARSLPPQSRFSSDHADISSSPLDGNNTTSKKAPTFGTFKGASAKSQSGPSLDEITMMRLKNAEKRRIEEKIRREEAATAAAEAE